LNAFLQASVSTALLMMPQVYRLPTE